MIVAIDVYYADPQAVVAGLLFPCWESDAIDRHIVKQMEQVAPYEPGAFYKRELPCILSLLSEIDQALEAIVIDGYVTLGAEGKDGLGMLLYNAIECCTPIVGVAKNKFLGTPAECKIWRGKSRNPLYITSVGIPLESAKQMVSSMHGQHRIPTILKKVDQLCRGIKA